MLASRIPSLWAEDYPTAGPLPLKAMGVNKLMKFLHACSDIVRTARPTLEDGTASVTELVVFPADTAADVPGGAPGGAQPPAVESQRQRWRLDRHRDSGGDLMHGRTRPGTCSHDSIRGHGGKPAR